MERSLLFHRPLRQAPCLPSRNPTWPRPPRLGRSAGALLPLPILRVKCSATYMESINHEIQVHLEKALPIRQPLTVSKPMRGLTFSASRSVAPALCVAACELVGGDRARAIPTAAALHILHAWSYFRDHFPLSDGPMCKLEPTISHEFGTNIELLTGDGMVPFGIELISRSGGPGHDNPEQNLRVIVEITRAIGSQGIIHGQYLQAKRGRTGEGEWDAGWVDTVREKKWGGLHGCAGACGAILGGGGEWEIGKLRKYGAYVGMVRGMREGVGGDGGIDRKAMEEELRGKAVGELEGMMQQHGGKIGPIMTLLDDHANRDE
ncbi:hypothetical protein MLD38_000543 [Melastoma candidum]|uniref:Uncharacterized protein n=1 Tax=Melastoma candidum TaxID=119954 RepID=A0ACB9SBB2_9MYRT|nr:hypothetical protein MLD38_000543 [Melastoma candidum]